MCQKIVVTLPKNLRIRVALYIRVSTEEQAKHGLSLADQREALTACAARAGAMDDNSARISRFVFSIGSPDLQSAKKRGCCHLLALLSDFSLSSRLLLPSHQCA